MPYFCPSTPTRLPHGPHLLGPVGLSNLSQVLSACLPWSDTSGEYCLSCGCLSVDICLILSQDDGELVDFLLEYRRNDVALFSGAQQSILNKIPSLGLLGHMEARVRAPYLWEGWFVGMRSQERLGFVHAEPGPREVWFTAAFLFGELPPPPFTF